MNLCLWCDDLTGSADVLCPGCRKVNDHPLFHCPIKGHLPTSGPECAECHHIAQNMAQREALNAPIVASLREIRAVHVREWNQRWPGCEFGKALVGIMIDGAIADLSEES